MLFYLKNNEEIPLNGLNITVSKKINGDHTLSFIALDTEDLLEELLIRCDGQLYRIKQVSAVMSGNKLLQSVTAKHISLDLIDYYAYEYLTNTVTFNNALKFLFQDTPFTYSVSDSIKSQVFEKLGEMNKQKLLAKIIDTYGVEYTVDNYHFTFKKKIGAETEFQFRYKANISNVKKEVDTTNLTTYIKGYGKKDEETDQYLCTAEYTSQNAEKFGVKHAEPIFDERFTIQSELLEYIKTKVNDTPDITVDLTYQQLDTTQHINLGDYGYLIHEPLQLYLQSRVIEIVEQLDLSLSTSQSIGQGIGQGKNCKKLTYKVGSTKLIKSSFETSKDSISGSIDVPNIPTIDIPEIDYDKIQAEIDKGVQQATDLINNGLGGYVTKTRDELLIMDAPEKDSARKLWRWNLNGLGFSSNGYSGPYETAITNDGKINADRILVGTLDGALIRANTIQANSLDISTVQKINSSINSSEASKIVETKLEVYDGTIKTHIKETTDQAKSDAVQDAVSQSTTNTNNALQNYPTISNMESAISQSASSIKQEVSKTYATNTDVKDKIDALSLENGYTIILSNEAQVIPTNSSRVPSTTTTYYTDIQVYKGVNKRTDYVIGTIASANGITVSKSSTRVSFAVSTSTALTADSGTFTIPITLDNKTFNKVFSWSCSKQGNTGATGATGSTGATGPQGPQGPQGESAKYVDIISSGQVFKSTDGGKTFSPNTIKLTPVLQNVTYSSWQYSTDGGANWSGLSNSITGWTISSGVLTISKDCSLFTDKITSVTFRVNTNHSSIYDTITLIKLYDVTDIQIGGRNYVKYSTFPKNTTEWSGISESSWTINSEVKYNGHNTISLSRTGLTNDAWQELRSNKILVKEGEKYSGSWYIKHSDCDMASIAMIWGYKEDGSGRVEISNVAQLTGSSDWQRYMFRGVIPSGIHHIRLSISHRRNGTIYAALPKVEKGTEITDWSPAPEDFDSVIDAVNDQLKQEITNSVAGLQNQNNELIERFDDAFSDNVLSSYEKIQLQADLKVIDSQYDTMKSLVNALNDNSVNGQFTTLTARHTELHTLVDPLLKDLNTAVECSNAAIREVLFQYQLQYNITHLSVQTLVDNRLNTITTTVNTTASGVETAITKSDSALNGVNTISKHFNFTDSGWVEIFASINNQPGRFKTQITDQRLSFLDNNVEVAYMSNQKLYITQAQILDSLQLGNIAMAKTAKGGLIYQWKG